MFQNFDLKKVIVYSLIIVIIIYVLRKIINSIKYKEGKTIDYKRENVKRDKTFYSGIALAIYNSIDGISDAIDDKQRAIDNLLGLNDDEIVYVNNIYNSKYTEGSSTMTSDILDEILIDYFWTDSRKRYLVKAKQLGIG